MKKTGDVEKLELTSRLFALSIIAADEIQFMEQLKLTRVYRFSNLLSMRPIFLYTL